MRYFFVLINWGLILYLAGCSYSQSSENRQWYASGQMLSEDLSHLDQAMKEFMVQHEIPAAALAVTYQGRLMYAKGFTWGNPKDEPVGPDSLFRIASISKPITAVAIFHLIEQGKLSLDDNLTDIIDMTPPSGQQSDPRLKQITVRHLLQHLGGWDRNQAFDPMFQDRRISRELKVKLPINTADIIKFMAGQPLQHDPGTTNAYSNFGYCLLGRIIEARTGIDYGQYVTNEILNPLGIQHMRLGRTKLKDRAPGEVRYQGTNGESPHGSNIENMDSHGGWLASAVELVRFASAFDHPETCPVLNPASIDQMFALPENLDPKTYHAGDAYYACGWDVRDYGKGFRNTWHNGSLPGTFTFMARWKSGIDCAVLFNKRGDGFGQIDPVIGKVVHEISSWPEGDLFAGMLDSKRPVSTE